MLTPFAFVQVAEDALACVEGGLEPAAYPRPGGPAFFAPDFCFSTDRPWWLDAAGARVRTLSRSEWAVRHPLGSAAPSLAWTPPDEGRFRRAFDSLGVCLDAGVLRKGVPITVMSAPLDAADAGGVFDWLLARVATLPPGVMAYGFCRPTGSAGTPEFLIGATPEVLFDLDGCHALSTMAVAGTRSASDDPGELERSPKDRDEHQAVVEDLLARLSEWGVPRAAKTGVRRFGQLVHLVADIHLEARTPLDFEAVARRLHPTPALGVYPRTPAGAEWLASIDPTRDRKRFGAPFGLRWPAGGGRALVAIRNLQYAEGRLEIWAGCGVVPMSRYEDEWQEILCKMRAVRALWGV